MRMTTLPLTRLNRRDGSAIIERIAAGKTLPGEVVNQILARTDGVPLFIEELTKTVLEGGLLQERDGVRARSPAAVAGDSDDAACVADGAARPIGAGAQEVAQIGAVAGESSPTNC